MPLDRPSINTIYERLITGIESRLTGGAALLRRAVLRVLAKVIAGAVHLLYGNLVDLSKQIMVDQAEDEWLDRHGIIWGIAKKSSSYASGTVTFYGENGVVIEEETLLQTSEGIEYTTTADVTIAGGVASVSVTAVEAGAAGNFTGSSVELVSPITGVTSSVDVVSPGFTGGVDEESNDDYRARILARIQRPPMGGTANDYIIWAESDEVSAANGTVERAWCFPLASGPGTVDVVITASGTSPVAPSGLITDVQAYIDTVKPVTADVTVLTVDDKMVDFTISIPVIDSVITESIINNLTDLFKEIAAPGEDMLIAQIRDAIMDSGVSNYEIDTILVDSVSVPIDDVQFTDYEYPILGTVTFNTL